MTHTPGPWTVEDKWNPDDHYAITALLGKTGRTRGLVANFSHTPYLEQVKANATLIASAPDLLVALENIIDWLERTGEDKSTFGKTYDYVVTAKEAIRKAKGS